LAASWRAPGRVNLIGEHTDYNDGFVLPFATGFGCSATVEQRSDDLVRVVSAQLGAAPDRRIGELRPGRSGWVGYALGVVWALRQRGLPGLEITLDSDVPIGAGLSSSAALVCSVAAALNDLLGLDLDGDELLAITRRAENEFVGAPTGGMDQLAALRCTPGHALFCDMRSLSTEQVPLELTGLRLLVVDTRAEHQHASGEYRRRREGCEEAARQLGLGALRDLQPAGLDEALPRLADDELRRYTRHVVTENDRVLQTVERLRAGDTAGIGPLLNGSQASMRDDFRITIPELDVAADTLVAAGALGARMTGAGFGGSTISLVPEERVDAVREAVTRAFADQGWAEPVVGVTEPGDGARRDG
jgi:galactokinase